MLSTLRGICVAAILGGAVIGTASAQTGTNLSDGPEVDVHSVPQSFSKLANRMMPAVVSITTSQTVANNLPRFDEDNPLGQFNQFFNRGDEEGFRRQGALGSGFVITEDGLIITNNHVIEAADEIEAVFSDGKTRRAVLIGRDEATDLAVLKVEAEKKLPFVVLADSDEAEVGDWVMAIGNLLGFQGSVSVGVVSALERDIQSGRYDTYIQTDAAINRGNSGGPLFTLAGEVLGVNTAIISPSGGSIGIGFSIPSNLVKQITDQIVELGAPRRGWLGVNVDPVSDEVAESFGLDDTTGVIVTNIIDESPAQDAKLEIGDLILSFDGREVESVRGLTRAVAETDVGKKVTVKTVRKGRARDVSVTLGELERPEDKEEKIDLPDGGLANNSVGLRTGRIEDGARRNYGIPSDVTGALVMSVSPRGPSFGKIRKGDVIIEAAFEKISSARDFEEALEAAEAEPDKPLLLRVKRRGRDAFFGIELDLD